MSQHTATLPPLPEGWVWTTLSQLGFMGRGKSKHRPRDDERLYNGQYPFIQTGEVKEANGFIKKFRKTYNDFGLSQSKLWKKGTLCITIAANIADTAILDFDACFPDSIVGFEGTLGITNTIFIELFFRTIKEHLEQFAPATAQKNINLATLENLAIPLPPLAEQTRIVEALETLFTQLDAGVQALKRSQANLQRYRAAVLKAACEGTLVAQDPNDEPASQLLTRILAERYARWEATEHVKGKMPMSSNYKEPQAPDTSNLPDLPDGWVWATMDQIGYIQGGIQKQPNRTPTTNYYPYLRVANVLRDKLDLSEVLNIELFDGEFEKLKLEVDDLLIVEGNGSQKEIGRSAIWKGTIQNCVHQNHIIRVRFNSTHSKFVSFYLNSPIGKKIMSQIASSTTGLHTLSVSKIRMITLPLPPLAEQARIVAEVERHLSVVQALEATLEANLARAERLRQSILKQAFSGQLVPQDPRDEPASLLLEQIRAERAPAPKSLKQRTQTRMDLE